MASKVTEGLATFPFSFECLLCRMGFRTKKGFHLWGVFQFTQVQPPPPQTPQTMLDACIQNFFRVSTLYRVGWGRTARKFRKGCPVLRGNREMTANRLLQQNINIAVLSQGLFSRIERVPMHARTLCCTTFCRRVGWRRLIFWSKIICNVFWFSRKTGAQSKCGILLR